MRLVRRILALACLLLVDQAAAEVYQARVTRIADGDTVWVHPFDGSAPRKLRLLGIDAPEICQRGGVASREALRRLLENRPVRVTVNFEDSYQRGLARLDLEGQDVAEVMVRQGQAWSSRWHGRVAPYAAQETQARLEGLGLFADPVPELPSVFRKRHGSCYAPRQ